MSETIESLFREDRNFPPDLDFARHANAHEEIYARADADRLGFWESEAERLVWRRRWERVLDDTDAPFYRWFVGGRLNVTESCLDRHLAEHADRIAFHWEGEPGDQRILTYRDLHAEVCRFGNALKELGVEKGDTVAIYMGMVPELPVAMLACARIGAAHSVVFGGFSADALIERINDASSVAVVTCDGAWRRGAVVPLKDNVDRAVERTPTVKSVVVVRRTEQDVAWQDGRDHWYHELVATADADCPAEEMDAEDLLYVLYTSGSTGKPKGITHTTGGYLTGVAATHRYVFDSKPDDVYWCTADCGWVTGHSYIVYGPLANCTTSVIYEGSPDYPGKNRFWELVERYRVTVFYTAPTAIRTFMKWGIEEPARHDLSSLRLLGSVGEPINPEAWMWYQEHIGGGRCPIVDTWWQTETGAIMITPLPGVTTTKPGSATRPFPGIVADVVDDAGQSVPRGHGGYLVLREPWPSMLRGIHGDPERYKEVYWSRFPGLYFAGDGCKVDSDGYLWLMGRVDDVMLVSGHNIATTEVESALVDHEAVAEAAVIGRKDERTGQAIAAFVILKGTVAGDHDLIAELRHHVAEKIGPIAKPASIVFTDDLPKTRSGKIMRRLLRDISEERRLGDVTTLANADIVESIRHRAQQTPDEEQQAAPGDGMSDTDLGPASSIVPGRYWQFLDDGRIQCDLCPRFCRLRAGQRGLCFVRARQGDELVLTTYGRSSGFCIDPIEKKPLNHFHPGTAVLSFGTAGCNLACKFCQNWDISKSREFDTLAAEATPAMIARAAEELGCRSVAFTYNDPVIFLEYAVDVAAACHDRGIATVAVTAGEIYPEPRAELFRVIDAANVDLKAFSERFYRKVCGASLAPVLETLEYLVHETDVWVEITTLLIPGQNDSDAELEALTAWVMERLGPDVPLHFTAFHPDYRMLDVPPTPRATLERARVVGRAVGLHHVYTGNVRDVAGGSTYCGDCGSRLIERSGYRIGEWRLDAGGCCQLCGSRCAGVFDAAPGAWGERRQPVDMQRWA